MADEIKRNTSEYTKEELERIAKIDKLDQNTGRKKLILAIVTAALILIFAAGTVFGGKYILSYEGTEELPVLYAEYPHQDTEISNLFSAMLKETLSNDHIKVNRSVSVSIPKESIQGSDSVKDYINYIRDDFSSGMEALYSDFKHEGTYGEAMAELLPKLYFNPTVCKISAKENEDDPSEILLTGIYDITETDALSEMFYFDRENKLKAELDNSFAGVMQITNPKFTLTNAELTARYLRNDAPNVLNSLVLTKTYHASFTGVFCGEKENAAPEEFSFDFTVSNRYDFSRVTFRFNDDVIYIEKGNNSEFKYTLITDESPADVKIDLVSENPEVVSIDKYGYYKGNKVADDPVTVTGSYTYLGKTYTDTIKVFVRTPVEDVKLSTKELTMAVGETKTLDITFKPQNAHIKEVKWFTENAEIATVDENGTITALKEGEVKIYLISLDGNFKRGCTVTVGTKGGNDNG